MYAISFDMVIADLKEYYGEPYHKAYFDIKEIMLENGFEWIQGSTYMSKNGDLASLYSVIRTLSNIEWFKKSVRDVRGFKVEDWSNFTDFMKE